MAYRTSAGGQYSCPRCLRTLTTYQAGLFVVDACLECGGLFIDNAASQELVRAFDRDLVTIATTIGIGKGESIGEGVIKKDLACPRCSIALAPVSLPGASVEVDICMNDGTWFDANELPKVARAYRRAREGKLVDMASDQIATILEGGFRGGPER
jgi:Zn-finger nucleic acid-binding protein